MLRPFKKQDDGTFKVKLGSNERKLLSQLADEMAEVLSHGSPDSKRLFPPAYANNAELEDEYRELVHDDLLRKRLEDCDVLAETADAKSLTPEQADRWLTALNSSRLVLGTRLDVGEEQEEVDPDDPDAQGHLLYGYLSYLLECLVEAHGG